MIFFFFFILLKRLFETHVYLLFQAGEVIDHVWLIKDQHKPYAQMCINNNNKG